MDAWAPIRQILPNAERALSERYGLPMDDALYDLTNILREYGTRDRVQGWNETTYKVIREEAWTDILAIISEAAEISIALGRLRKRAQLFARNHEWQPVLMQDLLSIDFGPPSQIYVPDELDPLQQLASNTAYWNNVTDRLDAVARLPVRDQRVHGRMTDVTLKKAVAACRDFWTSRSRPRGSGWTMGMLEQAETADDIQTLQKPAERFLVDVLGATGFEFDLAALKRVWRAPAR